MISDGWWLWCMMMVMIVTQMITWWYPWSYDMCGAYVPWSWWFLSGWYTWFLQQRHLIRMSYVSWCIGTSCVDSLGMTSSNISRSLGRLAEYHLHQLLFFSFHLHQLQPLLASAFILLQHPASSSQLPFAIDAKGGEMSLLGGAHPEGELVVSCHQWQRGRLLAKLSLAWSGCVLCLSLMSTESLIEVLSFV